MMRNMFYKSYLSFNVLLSLLLVCTTFTFPFGELEYLENMSKSKLYLKSKLTVLPSNIHSNDCF